MPRPLRVFLCHASQDKPTVWKLYRYLTQHGIKPWLDQEDLLPGEDWEVEIPRAIYASDVILVCLSKNSVNKEGMVQKEITFALDKAQEKPEGAIFIIPVKLEECDIPKRLSRYQWVDLSRVDGRKRLLMGLNKRASDLGGEVGQITLDDTRHRTPAPKSPKPEIPPAEDGGRSDLSSKPEIKKPEEQIVSVPVKEEIKEEPKKDIPAQIPPLPSGEERGEGRNEVKPIQKKPFTRILDPSSLPPKKITSPQGERQSVRKSTPNNNARLLGISGIVLIGLLFIVFGGNYLLNNLPPTKTPIPVPTLEIGSTMTSEKDDMVLVYVPAGTFTMGSDVNSDEQPIHQVDLKAFWIDQTEVTNKMYAKCVGDGVCKEPTNSSSYTHTSYYGNSEFDNYPVLYVDWNMAKAYCAWADRRLPTEAEWEKAARGTDGRTYPWGNESPNANLLNYNQNVGDTTAVKSYESGKSIYGAYDMAGNIWEWVSDWYSDTYYQSSPSLNPLGPDTGTYRVLRGGAWDNYDVDFVRSAYRSGDFPSYSNLNVGFRCARSP
jgi:formylglycine-generating enzyme required for sulfatase activity